VEQWRCEVSSYLPVFFGVQEGDWWLHVVPYYNTPSSDANRGKEQVVLIPFTSFHGPIYLQLRLGRLIHLLLRPQLEHSPQNLAADGLGDLVDKMHTAP
jgi:hypothetical protein